MKLHKYLRPGSRKNGSFSSSSSPKSPMDSSSASVKAPLSRSQSAEIYSDSSTSSAQSSCKDQADRCSRNAPGDLSVCPKPHIQELEHAFKYFDANGDGKISVAELGCVLRSLGDSPTDADLEVMVKEVDADGDGFVDFNEFVHLNTMMLGDCIAGVEELKAAFHVFDRDKNGFISAQELYTVLRNLGEKGVTMEDCNRMIGGVDSDGDGFVNFEEFQMMMGSKSSSSSNSIHNSSSSGAFC